MREELFTRLYNVYYSEAMAAGRHDIDASTWAYDQASSDIRDMNFQELRFYLKSREAA